MAHAHMMTRMTGMTRSLDSHDSLARWLAVCQDPCIFYLDQFKTFPITNRLGHVIQYGIQDSSKNQNPYLS